MNSSHAQVENILKAVRYCTISTVDKRGQPWAAPVWYVYDENRTLYWWSPRDSQHSINISRNNAIYITIFDSTAPEGDGLGLYIQATAQEVTQGELDYAMQLYNSSTSKFKLTKENCTAPAPTRAYKATSLKIWLNDGIMKDGFWQDIRAHAD